MAHVVLGGVSVGELREYIGETVRLVPCFRSDQYGARRFAGRRLATDTVRIEEGSIIGGAPDEGGFLAGCDRDGRTTAVLSLERPRPFVPARRELACRASAVEAAVASR
ncbi:hypothetical protein ACFPH6_47740 [Streptomyces xiangluensis]|uniref:Uncharacterized protein n=1 Tax=Streptomyces xiangluensis TaxID=2665720 RepID=A0ABV8Z4T6_9ACTN